jgi:hypothetical protein
MNLALWKAVAQPHCRATDSLTRALFLSIPLVPSSCALSRRQTNLDWQFFLKQKFCCGSRMPSGRIRTFCFGKSSVWWLGCRGTWRKHENQTYEVPLEGHFSATPHFSTLIPLACPPGRAAAWLPSTIYLDLLRNGGRLKHAHMDRATFQIRQMYFCNANADILYVAAVLAETYYDTYSIHRLRCTCTSSSSLLL